MTYKGFEIFPKEFIFLDGFNQQVIHDKFLIGMDYQNQELIYHKSDRMSFDVTLKFDTYDEYYKIRQWFKSLKGRYTKFWFPSILNEFNLIEPISIGNNSFKILNNGIDIIHKKRNFYLFFPNYDFVTKIINIENLGYNPNYNNFLIKVIIADPFPFSIKNLCLWSNFIYLGTLKDDSITFEFIDLVKGQVKFSFIELTQNHYKKLNIL